MEVEVHFIVKIETTEPEKVGQLALEAVRVLRGDGWQPDNISVVHGGEHHPVDLSRWLTARRGMAYEKWFSSEELEPEILACHNGIKPASNEQAINWIKEYYSI